MQGDYIYEKTGGSRKIGQNGEGEAKSQTIENRKLRMMELRRGVAIEKYVRNDRLSYYIPENTYNMRPDVPRMGMAAGEKQGHRKLSDDSGSPDESLKTKGKRVKISAGH